MNRPHAKHWGRLIANVPTSPDGLKRTCKGCNQVRPIKGGTIVNHRFLCLGCR